MYLVSILVILIMLEIYSIHFSILTTLFSYVTSEDYISTNIEATKTVVVFVEGN